ncbi:MAG: OmpH family outer membrane protein [Alphaproteobacteria bacterium]|nr:OmpH family outer membrane protein [Alphaproteobacteria bacterium]
MTKLLTGAAFAALALAAPSAAFAQRGAAASPILVVDTDRILATCTACVAANTQLQTLVTNGNARAQQLRTPLDQEAQSIETAANALQNMPAGAAKTQQETALRNRYAALQTRQNTANQELQRLEQNIQSTRANVGRQLGEKLTQIASTIMTQRGALTVFSKNATLANADSIDITNEVLAALNQQLPAVSITPLPQQQQTQGR